MNTKTGLLTGVVAAHAIVWLGSHVWFSEHPRRILVVVDSSFEMRNHYGDIEKWLTDLDAKSRYAQIELGTDKLTMGKLDEVKSLSSLTRSAYGRFDDVRFDTLYGNLSGYSAKYLLSTQYHDKSGFEAVKLPLTETN